MDLGLQGKIVLITGASSGLGFATARLLAAEGARVAINSRSPERLKAAAGEIHRSTGVNVLTLPGDVSDPAVPAVLVDQAANQLGGLDILIANAGGPQSGKFESFTDEQWLNALDVAFLSQMRLIRAALPYLRKSTSPAILTLTSSSVKQPIPDLVLSNSARSATIGLTKSLALQLGPEGIRINSILPGWTLTDRVKSLMEVRAGQRGTTAEQEMERQVEEIPLGRMGTPEEFAHVAVFLVSPAASFIHGALLPVDGGISRGS